MIRLEHVEKLDRKVEAAVKLIRSLREENSALNEKLESYKKRIDELEILIEDFKKDQVAIEDGVMRALEKLDLLEDAVSTPVEDSSQEPIPTAPPEETSETSPTPEDTDTDGNAVENEQPDKSEQESEEQESELDIF